MMRRVWVSFFLAKQMKVVEAYQNKNKCHVPGAFWLNVCLSDVLWFNMFWGYNVCLFVIVCVAGANGLKSEVSVIEPNKHQFSKQLTNHPTRQRTKSTNPPTTIIIGVRRHCANKFLMHITIDETDSKLLLTLTFSLLDKLLLACRPPGNKSR